MYRTVKTIVSGGRPTVSTVMPEPAVASTVSSLTAIQDCSSNHSSFDGVYGTMPGCAIFPLVALPVTNTTRTNKVENQNFIYHLAPKNNRKREQTVSRRY